MEINDAIQNILTAQYGNLAITIEVTDDSIVTAQTIVDQIANKFLYPPRMKIIVNNHRRFDELDAFVKAELLNLELAKVTKQQLFDRIQKICNILDIS